VSRFLKSSILPSRKRPFHGIFAEEHKKSITFLTVCTKDKKPWLANDQVHKLLHEIWINASAWKVGRYVIMPDHIHLFAANQSSQISLEQWVRYWKSLFTKQYRQNDCHWQSNYWDRQLRSFEKYNQKWDYVLNNPVRHKLVTHLNDWPYQGEIHELE
jgi:putative transposase